MSEEAEHPVGLILLEQLIIEQLIAGQLIVEVDRGSVRTNQWDRELIRK
jgi:hypothetical protein